ncbi:hypothetical protein [Arthrobacter sp. efr-133-R2A-120]|nr:hypothetical protein [Arthrobacter sp. efr-133-R2A-120]
MLRFAAARWISAYQEHRELISTGRVVADGDFDGSWWFVGKQIPG